MRERSRAGLHLLHGRQLLRARAGAGGALSGWTPAAPPLEVDAPGARLAVAAGRLYLVARGVLRVGTFGPDGEVVRWEDAPPRPSRSTGSTCSPSTTGST